MFSPGCGTVGSCYGCDCTPGACLTCGPTSGGTGNNQAIAQWVADNPNTTIGDSCLTPAQLKSLGYTDAQIAQIVAASCQNVDPSCGGLPTCKTKGAGSGSPSGGGAPAGGGGGGKGCQPKACTKKSSCLLSSLLNPVSTAASKAAGGQGGGVNTGLGSVLSSLVGNTGNQKLNTAGCSAFSSTNMLMILAVGGILIFALIAGKGGE